MQKKAYYIGLKPWEFKQFTLGEFAEYYDQQMKYHNDNNKITERFVARIMCLLSNINRDAKRKPTPFKEEDFIYKEKKVMTPEQMATVLKTITIAMGGEING